MQFQPLTQVCNHCKQELPITSFHKDGSLKYGHRYTCKTCAKVRSKQSRDLRNYETDGLYGVFHSMKKRCYSRGHDSYPRYGGRGIGICKEWLDNPNAFYLWAASSGYKKPLQIDRINNDAGYSPKNCRIVTPSENQRNSSNAKLNAKIIREIRKELRGPRLQKEIARQFAVSEATISRVATGRGWGDV